MFRFVPDHVGGVGTKRKSARKSCESCKKRHKRCSHVDQPSSAQSQTTPSPAGYSGPSRERQTPESQSLDDSRASVATVQRSEDETSTRLKAATNPRPDGAAAGQPPLISEGAYLRFVGDLSPEASFLANRDKGAGNHRAPSRRDNIGVWLGQKPDDQGRQTEDQDAEVITVQPSGGTPFQLSGLASLKALAPYLRRECMSVLPPDYEFGRISDLFYAKIDPLFPILHGEVLESHDLLDAVALKQCICLLAAADPSLRSYLRLPPHTECVLSQIEFRKCIAEALKQSLDMGFIRDKVVLLQVSALMAFYVDDRPSSSEVSAYFAAQAVQLAQTLGLHLGWPGGGLRTEKSRRIFWCVWVLDRLDAAINGRPILIHRQDMDERVLESVPEQIPSFRLFIRIARFLDDVISQYRPNATPESPGIAEATPSFEDLVAETGSADIGNALLASLELSYLAVVILQSRPRKHERNNERIASSSMQSFCAASIVSLASEELKFSITYWAVVPYAVSLATSIAYQSLRNSSIPYKRKRAYTLFHSGCDVLDELSKSFPSARTMARLAKDTLQEVERVSVNRNKAKPREERQGNKPPENSHSVPHAPPGMEQINLLSDVSRLRPPDRPAIPPPVGDGNAYSALDTASSMPLDPNTINDFANDFADVAGIFDHFDPSFELGRVDALFSANLDPTMPLFLPDEWTEWTDNNNNQLSRSS